MELLKKAFSPRYRELVRLKEEKRIRNMVRGKDLSKLVTMVTREHMVGGACTYNGVRIVGQDGKKLEFEGKNVWVTTKRSNWDIDTGRRFDTTGVLNFSGKRKIPFRKVLAIQQ